MNNLINEIVGERYYVLSQAGKGGFSSVYKVKDIKSGKFFALKEYITSDPANNERILEGIEKELNILKYCTHPCLPKIFNVIKEDSKFFLVMEYVEGTTLQSLIGKKSLKKKQVKVIMLQICSGLYYLHSLEPPIVYRDLKPSNIILKEDGSVKLIDFGISKRYNREIEVDELALGSKGFAAPEQYGNRQGIGLYNTDIRSDIYGIGTTMYYLFTGKVYNGVVKSIKIPRKYKKIIRKCTMKRPVDRYQNCIEVMCKINK